MNAVLTPGPHDKLQTLLQAIEANPYGFDLFSLLRQVESCIPEYPRLGRAHRYIQEPLQLGQEPSCAFATSTIAKLYHYSGKRKPKLNIYSFGLFGPNGAMPLVFTEYVKERMAHHGDYTLSDFADLFHNRLIMLFYRAWANAQSCASLDRKEDNFSRHLASLTGLGIDPNETPDAIANHGRWHQAGHLVQQTRSAEGLEKILANYFKVPVQIEQFVCHWLKLPKDQRSYLGGFSGATLGYDAVLGKKVRDRQHHFRIHLGPMKESAYNQFLPTQPKFRQLLDWVRSYIGIELSWDLHLILHNDGQTAGMQLGPNKHLGWNSWLGERAPLKGHLNDVILHPENILNQYQKPLPVHQHH